MGNEEIPLCEKCQTRECMEEVARLPNAPAYEGKTHRCKVCGYVIRHAVVPGRVFIRSE